MIYYKHVSDRNKIILTLPFRRNDFSNSECCVLYSICPMLCAVPQAGLCWSLYSLALEPLVDPLATFSLSLPAGWGEPTGWALTFLPLSPILLAAIIHLTCGARGVPKMMVGAWHRRKEDKGRHCCLWDRIASIPCCASSSVPRRVEE